MSGSNGTPANERRYSERAAARGVLHRARRRAAHGRTRLRRAVDGRASFPARGLRGLSQPDPARAVARHADQAAQVRLRLQHTADVASAPARRRLRDGRHRHRRPHHHGRRPRLSHPRGRDLRRAAARCGEEPRAVRGAAAAAADMLQRAVVPLQGQVSTNVRRRSIIAAISSRTSPWCRGQSTCRSRSGCRSPAARPSR